MSEQEKNISEYFEIKINNNKLRIEINNDKIMFILITGISYYKYIKEYNYDDITKELNLLEFKDINNIYNYIIKSKYAINDEEKKIIINNKEIKLIEKILTNDEIIKILMDEIKNQNDKLNELIKSNEDKDDKINKLEYKYNEVIDRINEMDKYKNKEEHEIIEENKDKNIISKEYKKRDDIIIKLKYRAEKAEKYNIFGKKFVENNKNNIKLNIDGCITNLKFDYELNQGYNTIIMNILNPIQNFEYMFYDCKYLANIDELNKLDTKYSRNFSYMFHGCSSLKDIKSLEQWDVSNGINFSYMFHGCSSLSDISPLKNWNLSNVINETPSTSDFISYNFHICFIIAVH